MYNKSDYSVDIVLYLCVSVFTQHVYVWEFPLLFITDLFTPLFFPVTGPEIAAGEF